MQQNPDRRSLPPGCFTHLDIQHQRWYYVHLQPDPPRVTFTHPADETPSSLYFPARSSTPQQQPSFRQSMESQLDNSSPQQPSRVSPTFASQTAIMQNPAVQQQPSYGNRLSFVQSTSSVQDYTSRQQQSPSPTVNNPSTPAMNHAPQSSAQSVYVLSVPQTLQTPSDNSHFSMYSTNSHGTTAQEMEFDASILYSSPMSVSPTSAVPSSSHVAASPNFQPQRRQMSLDDSESFTISRSNQAISHPRSQSVQVSNPATGRFQPQNVLRRRKTKAAVALATPIPPKPQPPATLQKPSEVPVYSLVAQAPLDTTTKPTTPSFQPLHYPKSALPSSLPNLRSNSNQNSGALQHIAPPRRPSLPPITSSNQQGLFMSQYPSMAPTSGSMIIPQQPLSPLRAQNTGGHPAIPSVSYVNNQVPSLIQPTLGLSNGIMGAPLNSPPLMSMNHTPSLMTMSSQPQLDGFSNGTTGLPMTSIPPLTFNQSQSLMSAEAQLNDLSNGTMILPAAPLVSPTLISPQPQQHNGLSNGLIGNNAMAQFSIPVLPQQQNMLSNGYAQGLPSTSAAQMQSGMTGQNPGVSVQQATSSTAQPAAQASPKDSNSKQLMKKVGMSLGKVVLKFGTKYALEQIGVEGVVSE